MDSVTEALIRMRREAGWTEGYHASYWACAHSVSCEGLKEGHDNKQDEPGVYHFDKLKRGEPYHRYQLFRDGVAKVIVWLIFGGSCQNRRAEGEKGQ